MKQYIFGYGTLILKESRDLSGISGDWTTVRVKGLKRIWNDFKKYGIVVPAVIKEKNYSCNGVIFEVDRFQLENFDERENQYDRIEIPKNSITFLEKKQFEGQFWVYVQKDKKISHTLDILRTYLDVVLSGCLVLSKDFAKEFVETTYDWTKIRDDRKKPEYERALKEVKYDKEIKKLLKSKNYL